MVAIWRCHSWGGGVMVGMVWVGFGGLEVIGFLGSSVELADAL